MVTRIRHDWPEARGFRLVRPKGHPQYTFLHFCTPVTLELAQQTIQVKPGGCIIFPPGVPQYFTAHVPLVHNWFHAEKGLQALLERYRIPVGQLFYPREPERITEQFRKMEWELFSENPYKEDLLDDYLREFLIFLSRAMEDAPASQSISESQHLQLKQMRQSVLSNPSRSWTIEEMAQLVGLSPSRYHCVYKTMFGISPVQDLIEARTEYAKSLLLQQSDLPLSAVAEKLGYHDQFHFIRQFRQKVGMTPGQFRKENQ